MDTWALEGRSENTQTSEKKARRSVRRKREMPDNYTVEEKR